MRNENTSSVYLCTNVHVWVYVHVCVYIYIYMCVCVCVCVCVCARARVRVCVSMCECFLASTHMPACVCACMYACVRASVTYTCTVSGSEAYRSANTLTHTHQLPNILITKWTTSDVQQPQNNESSWCPPSLMALTHSSLSSWFLANTYRIKGRPSSSWFTCRNSKAVQSHSRDLRLKSFMVHTSDLKSGILVAIQWNAWCYRVSARICWPNVSVLRLDEIVSVIWSFHLSQCGST